MPRLQYMPINDFDRGLIEQFEAHDYEYNPAQWNRLAEQLPERQNSLVKRYIWLPLSGIAAAIALLIGVPMMMKKGNDNQTVVATRTLTPATNNTSALPVTPVTEAVAGPVSPEPQTPSVAENNSRANNRAASGLSLVAPQSSGDETSQPGTTRILPLTTNVQVLTPVHSLPGAQTSAYRSGGLKNSNTVRHFAPQLIAKEPVAAEVIPHAEVPVYKTEQQPIAVNLQRPVERLNTAEQEKQHGGGLNPRFDATIDPDDIGLNQSSKKASLSIAGGYNQGSTNVGYMVGVNTRKHLGNKLYVEGDVAFAANRNNDQTLSMQTSTYESYARNGGFANNLKSSPATSEVSNLYYLQVTPTVGYQLMNKLSVGAGADVQRLFHDGNKTAFIAENGKMTPVPTMDYGLVGKTEYSLLKNLKAGVQYRYGMNNVLAPDKNYVNRSYLQVQLKLGILGNK